MKTIKAYKLTDGRVIEDEDEAITLQREIDLRKALTKFADRVGSCNSDRDTIFFAILNNKDELKEMLVLLT